MEKHKLIVKRLELNVLCSLIKFKETRHTWTKKIDSDTFIEHVHKDIFNVIIKNKGLGEYELLNEINNDSIINSYSFSAFEQFYDNNTTAMIENHFIEDIIRYKQYRDLSSFVGNINPLNPVIESDKMLSLINETSGNEFKVSTARDCYSIIAKKFLSGKEELKNLKPLFTNNDVDNVFGGFNKGLYLISGEPGAGKTTFGIQTMYEYSRNNTKKMNFFFSMEVDIDNISEKVCSYESKIGIENIKNLVLDKDENDRFSVGFSSSVSNLLIVECEKVTTFEALAYAKKYCEGIGMDLGMMGFDYLQLMNPTETFSTKTEKFENISSDLRVLAKLTPVMAISSLVKSIEPNKCPANTELKGSGDIMYDAKFIVMLWRKDANYPNEITSRVTKNRFGRFGFETEWDFNGPIGRFEINHNYKLKTESGKFR